VNLQYNGAKKAGYQYLTEEEHIKQLLMLGDWELKAAEQPGNVCGVYP
jgi:hypothetical protein